MTEQELNNHDEQPLDEQPLDEEVEPEDTVEAEDDDLLDEDEEDEDVLVLNRRVVLGALGIVALLAIAAGAWFLFLKPAPTVITVNGSKLSGPQFSDQVAFEYYLQTGGQPLNQMGITADDFASFALEGFVDSMLIAQQADAAGVTVTEDDITAEEERVFGLTGEEGSLSRDEYETQKADFIGGAVEVTGLSADRFEELLRDRLKIALQARGLIESLDLPVDETQDAVHAAHILVATEEEANDVLARLDAGEDFGALAQELSLDTGSAANGGDLDWFPQGVMVAPFNDAVFAMQPGEISDPVQTQFGYHIIKVIERDQIPLSDQEKSQQESELFQAKVGDWRAVADVVIDDSWHDYVPDLQ